MNCYFKFKEVGFRLSFVFFDGSSLCGGTVAMPDDDSSMDAFVASLNKNFEEESNNVWSKQYLYQGKVYAVKTYHAEASQDVIWFLSEERYKDMKN